MPRLSNDALRVKSMRTFLVAMGVDVSSVEITSIEGLFSFSFADARNAAEFARRINKLTYIDGDDEAAGHKFITLSELIGTEVATAQAASEEDRDACRALFDIIQRKSTFSFSPESGMLEVRLSSPAYAGVLQLLGYNYLTFRQGVLFVDIKKYLTTVAARVVTMQGLNPQQAPLVLLNADLSKQNQMYYATRPLADGNIEVTPYFFVPQAVDPLAYHLVIDVSESMKDSLAKVKESVIALAEQLFANQPNATVTVTTFSNEIRELGVFNSATLGMLIDKVRSMQYEYATALYAVTAKFMGNITSQKGTHHNVLLFTDGEDTCDHSGQYELGIKHLTKALAADRKASARNKFTVFSYNAQQRQVMHDVAGVFGCKIVDTASPDFVAAMKNLEELQAWAAARGLFTARCIVSSKWGGDQLNSERSDPLDMSGQLASLPPIVCKPGDTLKMWVTGDNDRVVVRSTTVIRPVAASGLDRLGVIPGAKQSARVEREPGMSAESAARSAAGI